MSGKKSFRNYSSTQMQNALLDVEKGVSFKEAATTHGVPRSTLKAKHVKKYKKDKMGPEATLPEKYENDLVIWMTTCAKRGFPVTREQLCHSVKQIVVDNGIPNKFTNNYPGYKWVELFKGRHKEITVRKSQLQEKCRKEVTQPKIDKWFTEVGEYIAENNLQEAMEDPSRVFNCDESAFFLAPSKHFVLVPRTERRTYSVSGNNEKENLTALIGSNAAGQVMPPMIIFKYERLPRELVQGVPKDWGIGRSENGWMTCAVFYEYITNVFYPWLLKNKIKLPIVLFLDGHVSHLSLQLSGFCSAHGIHLIALYPHATHLLQPMDVTVFKDLKLEWKVEVIDWKFRNSEITLPRAKFAELLQSVLARISIPNIKTGFRLCGLFPFTQITISNTQDLSLQNQSADAELTWNERMRFLGYIEIEIGEEKVQDFKANRCLIEDQSLFQLWKQLKSINSTSTSHATYTRRESSTVVSSIETSTNIEVNNDGLLRQGRNIHDLSEIGFSTDVPPSHSTPVRNTSLQSPRETISSLAKNTSPTYSSPRCHVSTPVKQLHWPKYVPKKKGQISGKKEGERVPFAITSKKWQDIFKEKEEKKEKLEQEKLARKRAREEKKQEKEMLQAKKQKKRRKNLPDAEDQDSDLDMDVEAIDMNVGEEIAESMTVKKQLNISEGDFIIGKLVYDFGTRKETEKKFVGKVVLCRAGRLQDQYEVHFFRKTRVLSSEGEPEHYFTSPQIIDKWLLKNLI